MDSQVGFALKVKYFIVLRRTMLTTVTLNDLLVESQNFRSPSGSMKTSCTYNNPTLNIDKILSFFSSDNLNFQIVGSGSKSTAISANMLRLEFAHPCALILEHFPTCSPSQYVQLKLTGQHLKTQAQNKQKTAAEQSASPILMFRLML